MQKTDDNAYFDVIETAISKAKIPLKAVLGTSTISVNDFVNLQKGDIIKIDRQYEDELDVYVGNMLKFKALPGSATEHYAVKITKVIREE
jgi:flagellar motor switch protein FliM